MSRNTHVLLNPSANDSNQLRQILRIFVRHRLASLGLIGLFVLMLLAILGPLFISHAAHQPDLTAIFQAPSFEHWMGTDQLGRDLFARVLSGAQVSISVALSATIIATLLGCVYGLIAGMAPVWLDKIMMQLLDAILALPVLLLVIVSQAFGESSLLKVIIVIGLASWMATARLMRSECRTIMASEFVAAAIVGGASKLKLALVHVLPNASAPLLVVVTVGVGQAVLIEATLSFLNLGVPVSIPSWGNLLGNGMSSVLSGAWWVVLFPGVMVVIAVLSINLIGDGLRDVIDPKRRAGV